MKSALSSMLLFLTLLLPACDGGSTAPPGSKDWRAQNKSFEDTVRMQNQANENAEGLKQALLKHDAAAANAFLGKLVSLTGKPVSAQPDRWTLETAEGIQCVALLDHSKDQMAMNIASVQRAGAMGPLKEVDVASLKVTIEDADLVIAIKDQN